MAKDFFGKLEATLSSTGKAAAKKAKEVAGEAKKRNEIRVAKNELDDLFAQVGKKYFEANVDYPDAEFIDLFNLIEKLQGDIQVLEEELKAEEAEEEEEEDTVVVDE